MSGRLTQGDVLAHQDIGCTLRGELSGSDGGYVGPMTEAIGEQQDVGVASWCDRKEAEVVNTDGDNWTFRQRHCGDGPADSQPWGFPRLALQAVAKPSPSAHTYANPPIRTLQHAQRAPGAKVAGGRRVTSLHDPRVHEHGNVDANWLSFSNKQLAPQSSVCRSLLAGVSGHGRVGKCHRRLYVVDRYRPIPWSERQGRWCER